MLGALLLTGCTSSDTPAPPVPLPAEKAAGAGDACAELLPAKAVEALVASGVRSGGKVSPVFIPLTSLLGGASAATEGCELRLEDAPQQGVVVRRVFDATAISDLRKAIRETTDELPDGPAGWDVRWSDAASTAFVFSEDDRVQEAYLAQLVLQRPGVDRRATALSLLDAVLGDAAGTP